MIGKDSHCFRALLISVHHPGVLQDLGRTESLLGVLLQDALQQGQCTARNLVFKDGLALDDLLMQFRHIRCFERHCSVQHSVKHDASGPDIRSVAFITLVLEHFRCDIGRCATLLSHDLAVFGKFGDSEVTNFDLTLTG